MNFGELKTLVADYGHRTDQQTVNKIPGFIDLATKRIGRDLMGQVNTIILDPFQPASGMAPLPDDYRNMKEISWLQATRRVQLKSGSVDTLANYTATADAALFYKVQGLSIEIKPFSARDYRLIYYAQPAALVNDEDTNLVLDAYPYLYLYASLVELWFYVQNGGAQQSSLETYTSEITETNRQSANAAAGGQLTIGG